MTALCSSSESKTMGTFSYTKKKKNSMGNKAAYQFTLVNVQTSGSILHTPFKKIEGYLIETTSPGTSQINVAANAEANGPGTCARLTFAAAAEAQGSIIITGLF